MASIPRGHGTHSGGTGSSLKARLHAPPASIEITYGERAAFTKFPVSSHRGTFIMTLTTFEVEFDRPNATYAPGELVRGDVIVNLTSEKSIRGLYVTAKGNAEVTWSERISSTDTNGRSRTETRHRTRSEHYFSMKYPALGGGGNSSVLIPPGNHRYQFAFQLPFNIPCSFETENGYIRYFVKAVMDRPWKFDHECKAAFTVITPLDLNTHSSECVPIEDEERENFCCFCCFDMGSMNIRVRLPASGYVPGQVIQTMVNIHNMSSGIDVTKICTKLQRSIKLHTDTGTNTEVSNIVERKFQRRFSEVDEITSELDIPPIPPSRLEYCGIIDLDYTLAVHIHVSGVHCQIEKCYPILIGTIPLRVVPSAPGLEGSTALPSAPPLIGIEPSQDNDAHATSMPMLMPMPMPTPFSPPDPNDPAPPYPDPSNKVSTSGSPGAPQPLPPIGFTMWNEPTTSTTVLDTPPPSYEECMSGARHIRDREDSEYVRGANVPFAPRYPMFNIPAPQLPKP